MTIKRKIFVSAPEDEILSAAHKAIKNGIVNKIKQAGYEVAIFDRLRADKPWSLEYLHDVERHCMGAAIIGLPRYAAAMRGKPVKFASELCHLEGGVAYELDLPLFVLVDETIKDRGGIFEESGDFFVLCVKKGADESWLETEEFLGRFDSWIKRVKARDDVFLGYCGCAADLAAAIKAFLATLGVNTRDWQSDFLPTGQILDEIKKAASSCSSGIFLFTKDDPMDGTSGQMAPRDNVILETGFFLHAKGRDRVLIIAESGAKMPVDLGGSTNPWLADRHDIEPIKEKIWQFVTGLGADR